MRLPDTLQHFSLEATTDQSYVFLLPVLPRSLQTLGVSGPPGVSVEFLGFAAGADTPKLSHATFSSVNAQPSVFGALQLCRQLTQLQISGVPRGDFSKPKVFPQDQQQPQGCSVWPVLHHLVLEQNFASELNQLPAVAPELRTIRLGDRFNSELAPLGQLQHLSELSLGHLFNCNLTGIDKCENLKKLTIGNAFAGSLFPLGQLKHLTDLKIGNGFTFYANGLYVREKHLPGSLRRLSFGHAYNDDLDMVTRCCREQLEELVLGDSFNRSIMNLQEYPKLIKLVLGNNFNREVGNMHYSYLPLNLEHLSIGDSFNKEFFFRGKHLKVVQLGHSFNQKFGVHGHGFPKLRSFTAGFSFNQEITFLEHSTELDTLRLGSNFDKPVASLAVHNKNLRRVVFPKFCNLWNDVTPLLLDLPSLDTESKTRLREIRALQRFRPQNWSEMKGYAPAGPQLVSHISREQRATSSFQFVHTVLKRTEWASLPHLCLSSEFGSPIMFAARTSHGHHFFLEMIQPQVLLEIVADQISTTVFMVLNMVVGARAEEEKKKQEYIEHSTVLVFNTLPDTKTVHHYNPEGYSTHLDGMYSSLSVFFKSIDYTYLSPAFTCPYRPSSPAGFPNRRLHRGKEFSGSETIHRMLNPWSRMVGSSFLWCLWFIRRCAKYPEVPLDEVLRSGLAQVLGVKEELLDSDLKERVGPQVKNYVRSAAENIERHIEQYAEDTVRTQGAVVSAPRFLLTLESGVTSALLEFPSLEDARRALENMKEEKEDRDVWRLVPEPRSVVRSAANGAVLLVLEDTQKYFFPPATEGQPPHGQGGAPEEPEQQRIRQQHPGDLTATATNLNAVLAMSPQERLSVGELEWDVSVKPMVRTDPLLSHLQNLHTLCVVVHPWSPCCTPPPRHQAVLDVRQLVGLRELKVEARGWENNNSRNPAPPTLYVPPSVRKLVLKGSRLPSVANVPVNLEHYESESTSELVFMNQIIKRCRNLQILRLVSTQAIMFEPCVADRWDWPEALRELIVRAPVTRFPPPISLSGVPSLGKLVYDYNRVHFPLTEDTRNWQNLGHHLTHLELLSTEWRGGAEGNMDTLLLSFLYKLEFFGLDIIGSTCRNFLCDNRSSKLPPSVTGCYLSGELPELPPNLFPPESRLQTLSVQLNAGVPLWEGFLANTKSLKALTFVFGPQFRSELPRDLLRSTTELETLRFEGYLLLNLIPNDFLLPHTTRLKNLVFDKSKRDRAAGDNDDDPAAPAASGSGESGFFDRALPELPGSLEQLVLNGSFDHPTLPSDLLANTKSLKTLTFGPQFSSELPQGLLHSTPELEALCFEGYLFNRTLPDDFFVNTPKLKSLVFGKPGPGEEAGDDPETEESRPEGKRGFDRALPTLPGSLEQLVLSGAFNQPLPAQLPAQLRELRLGWGFNQKLRPNWLQGASKLEKLVFRSRYRHANVTEMIFPASLRTLSLPFYFNEPLRPEFLGHTSISQLWLGEVFDQAFRPEDEQKKVLPETVEEVHFGSMFAQEVPHELLKSAPNLRRLVLGSGPGVTVGPAHRSGQAKITRAMTVAMCFLTYGGPHQRDDLWEPFRRDPRYTFYSHNPKTRTRLQRQKNTRTPTPVQTVYPEVSMVRAEGELYRVALEQEDGADSSNYFFVFLSNTSAPLVGPDELYKRLVYMHSKIFDGESNMLGVFTYQNKIAYHSFLAPFDGPLGRSFYAEMDKVAKTQYFLGDGIYPIMPHKILTRLGAKMFVEMIDDDTFMAMFEKKMHFPDEVKIREKEHINVVLPYSTPDEATFVFWCHYKAQPNGEYCAVEFDFQHWDLDETDEIKTFKVVDPIEGDPGICPGMFDQEENNTQEKWFIRKVNRNTKMVHKYPVCQINTKSIQQLRMQGTLSTRVKVKRIVYGQICMDPLTGLSSPDDACRRDCGQKGYRAGSNNCKE